MIIARLIICMEYVSYRSFKPIKLKFTVANS